MQIYSSPEFFGNYHVNFPVTASHPTSGMRTRMSALHYALQLPVITDISEAEGDLLVEPFAVKPREDDRRALAAKGWPQEEWYALEEQYTQQLCNYDRGRKFLICSEMEVLRWRDALREKVLSTMEDVFTTCNYQQNLVKAVGIQSKRLAEPVSEFMFYPGMKKTKQIVASGAANHVKNTKMLIDFYRALEGKGYHRVYIGGPIIWGYINSREKQFRYNMDLYHELKTVCDEFHEGAAGTLLARIFSESEFYANFAYHEVGCRSVLEALMSGCGILWGLHPLGEELPVLCMAETVNAAVSALKEHTGKVNVQKMRDHTLKYHSFASIKKQLEGYLYGH